MAKPAVKSNSKSGSKSAFMPLFIGEDESLRMIVKAGLIEGLAMAAFLFVATGTVTSGKRDLGTDLGASTLANALAFGFMIFVGVYATASFSGGHLNPAVTLGFLVTRKISLVRAITYMALQCGGACAGSALVKALDPNGFTAADGGANQLSDGVSHVQAWGTEAIMTFMLVFVVFAATDSQRSAGTPHLPILAPFAIGMIVFLAHLVLIPIDGCSINPARSFGTAATAHIWHNMWIFWVGPFSGSLAAAAAYELGLRVSEATVLENADSDTHGKPVVVAEMGTFAGMEGLQKVNVNGDDIEAQKLGSSV